MRNMHFSTLVLACILNALPVTAKGQSKPAECPAVRVDTSSWVAAVNEDVGIELKHPATYREKHWENRSDTVGIAFSFWRDAVHTIDFHEARGFWATRGPSQSAAQCLLTLRSAELRLRIERSLSTLPSGRDTVYFLAKAIFGSPGRPQMVVTVSAPDSTALLEELAILRTISFLRDR